MKTRILTGSLLGLTLIYLACSPLPAQQYIGGMALFSPGIQSTRLSLLNNYLPRGLPEIQPKPWIMTGEVYLMLSNIMIGGQGGTQNAGTFGLGYQLTDLTSRFRSLSVGYLVYSRKGLYVFPSAAVGTSNLEIYIHRTNQWITFQSVGEESYHATTLYYKRPMIRFSMTGTWIIDKSRTTSHSGLVIGLEAGFQAPARRGTWTYDNGRVKDGPDINPGGFFLQLIIGGGVAVDFGEEGLGP